MRPAFAAPAPVLRAVLPPEVPFPGVLSATRPPRYRVAASDAPAVVALAQPGGHVLAAEDIDGVDDAPVLVLPALRARLAPDSMADGLGAGSTVTLAVSVLRGAREARDLGIDAGEWWVTHDGRPVLVPRGDEAVTTASCRLIEPLVSVAACGDAVAGVIDLLAEGELDGESVDAAEERLFAIATPEPLPAAPRAADARSGARPTAAVRAEAVDPARRAARRRRRGHRGRSGGERATGVAGMIAATVGTGIDADLGRRAAGATTALFRAFRRAAAIAADLGRRARSDGSRRRAPLAVVAAAAMGLTLALGMALTGEPTSGAGATSRSGEEGAPHPSPDAVDATDSGSDRPAIASGSEAGLGADLDPAAAAEAAVDALARCLATGESTCRGDVLERADAAIPTGVATDGGPRTVTLLDDLGGVVVVRVDDGAGAQPSQIVVVVEQDGKRLVRDVYDVADQP